MPYPRENVAGIMVAGTPTTIIPATPFEGRPESEERFCVLFHLLLPALTRGEPACGEPVEPSKGSWCCSEKPLRDFYPASAG